MAQAKVYLLPLFLFFLILLSLEAEFHFIRTSTLTCLGLEGQKKGKHTFPDFYKYRRVRTLAADEITTGNNNGRVIIIGDVHGMNDSFHNLLSTVSYSPDTDTLILSGDFLAKTGLSGSLDMLDFLAHSPTHVYAVRGNHDQMVVEWRAWRDWFESLHIKGRTGAQFLETLEADWHKAEKKHLDPGEWAHTQRKRAERTWRAEWWRRIPTPGKGREKNHWEPFAEHYWLAKAMTREHAQLLYDMPSVIHIPSEHMFVVHGGMLPFDLRRSPTDERQPLAHPPTLDFTGTGYDIPQDVFASQISEEEGALLRTAQEQALLSDVRDNRDNWALINMRGVRHGKVTPSNKKGTPWSKLWNDQMSRCAGFDEDDDVTDKKALPCEPSTVVYGHAAARGLDVKRWSFGLDTGCMYGRRLTALVLQHERKGQKAEGEVVEEEIIDDDDAEDWDEDDRREAWSRSRFSGTPVGRAEDVRRRTWRKRATFGDKGGDVRAELVSVKCEVPDDVE